MMAWSGPEGMGGPRGEGRGLRAPPGAATKRSLALLALLAVAAALVAFGAEGRSGAGLEPGRTVPFDPGTLTGAGIGGVTVRVARDQPVALLYVDEQCPYCARELRAWEDELGGSAPNAAPRVVLSPRSGRAYLREVAPSLAARALHDVDGSIARALGLRGVPLLVLTDTEGAVVSATAGVSSEKRRREVATMLNIPRRESGR